MTAPAAPRRRPPGRYDDPPRLAQKGLAVVLGVLFLGLLASIAYALYVRLDAPVRARVVGYTVESDRLVRIDLEVVKDEGAQAYCVVRARGASGAEVGRRVVAVDPTGDGGRVVRRTYDLPTTERAVTGEEGACDDELPSDVSVSP